MSRTSRELPFTEAEAAEWAVGIALGAETLQIAWVDPARGDDAAGVRWQRAVPHAKDPAQCLTELIDREPALARVERAASTGRLARRLSLPQVPTQAALRRGVRELHPELGDITVLNVGARGALVLECFASGREHGRQNPRCSQGTGNFLAQLVERFGLSVEEASLLAAEAERPAPLSGRCPVILKTDLTHLANRGESRTELLAGLYDAIAENVVTLLRPRQAPPDVLLLGGVMRSERLRRRIGEWLSERGMRLVAPGPLDDVLEAVGAAHLARELPRPERPPFASMRTLFAELPRTALEQVPPLSASLGAVTRMPPMVFAVPEAPTRAVLGLDIGSTGSKCVAVEEGSGRPLFEAYLGTEGSPVSAAQGLVEAWRGFVESGAPVELLGFGVTGSGREITGSLLRTCYGDDRVFVLNEIAAHARGALSIDPDVDTIFEIGGQDAKYIRLDAGRVVDAAMNEACSAGTGSFIAEQGKRLDGADTSPARLGEVALAAPYGVSLGQHCSVFMAEVIDEAVAQGVPRESIVMGLYDSVIQNYLNRVKGARTIGDRIFCQGMPFSASALAAAVARQTGRSVVVPPNPGTVGALGIALLARDALADRVPDGPQAALTALEPSRFLAARVTSKEVFVCRSTKGCGGAGNKCKVDRLVTQVGETEQRFVWGGSCSLYDRAAARGHLPDGAPDPFRARSEHLERLLADIGQRVPKSAPVIGFSEEFVLKGHVPLFATFLAELGFKPQVLRGAGGSTLKKGIEGARVPYCAPMQLFHGTTFELAGDANVKAIFIPLLRSLPRVAEGDAGELCPIALGSPDVVGGVLDSNAPRVVRPVIDFDEAGYQGERFEKSMRAFAYDLGRSERFEAALARAVRAQEDFERALEQLGREALSYCSAQGIVPVVVHGRPYTIHNDVLNSNVPRLLRALGAIAIPLDCFPLEQQKASLPHQYWSYTQRNLQAAISVRRTPGVYSVFCSNYACGPDSFTLHFFAYVMKNKPFAVIETDGHAGDAGTKTRLEAFLHCVDSDLRTRASEQSARTDFAALDDKSVDWPETKRRRARVLLPRMSENARVAAAALASEGFRAEALPPTTREDVRLGRQHTSGKECVPMMLTLGTLLRRLGELPEDESVTFFMPTTRGPCRFGVYHSLHKIVLERLGYADRVDIVSPDDTDYYRGMRRDFSVRLWLGFVAHDLLEAMLYDVRPIERTPGAAKALYTRYLNELVALLERPSQGNWASALVELATGMWGIRPLLQRAAREFGAQKVPGREVPRVSVVGEIYVRLDPFANDFVVDKLEERGIGVRFAPFTEWLEYTTFLGEERLRKGKPWPGDSAVGTRVTGVLQRTTLDSLYGIAARSLGWPKRMTVRDTVEASRPYVDEELDGEAALTLGGPLHERHAGLVHGVVMVGPHECMPCKIAEAQFGKVTEDEPLPVLSLALTGDPVDPDLLDRFAFDVRAEFARQQGRARVSVPPRSGRFSRVLERVTGPASGPASGALRVPPRSSEGSQQRRSLPMFDDREDASAAGE